MRPKPIAEALIEQRLGDLRFGYAPLPTAAPGYYPAGDAQALMLPSVPSPAHAPVPGVLYTGSYAPGERFVVRVPHAWNGSLIVAGTPGTRCEFTSDLVWGEFALARGYAYAASNKGIRRSATLDLAADAADRRTAYPVPFPAGGLLAAGMTIGLGLIAPERVTIEHWNDDYEQLVAFTRDLLARKHAVPAGVYAVGVSNGGAQVRTLLERHPELVDGGVDWAGVYWTPERSLLDDLPAFLRELPAYAASGFRDTAALERLVALGFPRDVIQDDPAHPSLYAEFYSNGAPFYADLTLFAYALLIDPDADSWFDLPPFVAEAKAGDHAPAVCRGRGLALPENRAAYAPSPAARAAIASFAHTGSIGKPLVSIAGTLDAFIPPEQHAVPYARAVERAGRGALHELFLVAGGTHVDTFAAYGYGIRAQAPFAWAAFDRLVRNIEGNPISGCVRTVTTPAQIA